MANDPRFEVYPQMRPDPEEPEILEPTGEFGWRFRAANGQIIAIGGEGFTRREDAHRAVRDLCEEIVDFLIDGGEGYVLNFSYSNVPILDVGE